MLKPCELYISYVLGMSELKDPNRIVPNPGFILVPDSIGLVLRCSSQEVADYMVDHMGASVTRLGDLPYVVHVPNEMFSAELQSKLEKKGFTVLTWEQNFSLWYALTMQKAQEVVLPKKGYAGVMVAGMRGIAIYVNSNVTAENLTLRLSGRYQVRRCDRQELIGVWIQLDYPLNATGVTIAVQTLSAVGYYVRKNGDFPENG